MTINRDETHGVYVMAYSPWPGFVDRIYVARGDVAPGAVTAPVEVLLPGCNDTVGGATYYCYAGPASRR